MVVKIVPEPVKLKTTDKFFYFDGFSNFPEFLSKEFNIPKGTWTIKKVEREGTGLKICDKTVEIWGNENICYATLIQIIKQTKTKLPELLVKEKFTFKFRGFHLDIARGGVPKVETFKRILRWLFLLKYNYFAIYFEDLFPWEKYPQIGRKRGRLSRTELNEVIEYGKKLGVEVFPSLELTGHMENILTLPEFRKYSEWHNPREGCLDVSNEEAREFAYSLLKEVLEYFPSKYIHIGGDETWALGRGKSLNRTWTFQGPELYLMHHENMVKLVEKYGKKPMLWGDMLTGMYLGAKEREKWKIILESDIWRRVTIANWDYSPSSVEHFREKIRLFKEQDYEQVVCPGFSNWNRYYPDFETALTNLTNFLTAAREEQVLGFMVTAWGDDGEECLFSLLDPLLLATMEIAEGSGEWERKWTALTGENENQVRVRKTLGRSSVSNNIKKALYFWGEDFEELGIKEEWENILREIKDIELPPDLSFIRECIRIGVLKARGKVSPSDYIALSRDYSRLWLNERKPEGLERIIIRMWGAAGLADSKIKQTLNL